MLYFIIIFTEIQANIWSGKFLLMNNFKVPWAPDCEVFLFVDTNFRGFFEMHWSMSSWNLVSNTKGNSLSQWENCISLGFNFRSLSQPRNPLKNRTPRLITISQYLVLYTTQWCVMNTPPIHDPFISCLLQIRMQNYRNYLCIVHSTSSVHNNNV
jgi:hypothetical protein